MVALIVLLVCCTAVFAYPERQQRIVGGWDTSISVYPEVASLLYSYSGTEHSHACGGTILNLRSVMTAANCVENDPALRWQFRVGSSYANSRGTVYHVTAILSHGNYTRSNRDNDIAILRSQNFIVYNSLTKPGTLSGTNYHLADGEPVWAVGWGHTTANGFPAEELRQVQIWSVNQATCKQRYAVVGRAVTENMLCSGWLDVGGRGHCEFDNGGPIFHNKVVVGITSWSFGCAQAQYPGVSTRVSKFASWLQTNA